MSSIESKRVCEPPVGMLDPSERKKIKMCSDDPEDHSLECSPTYDSKGNSENSSEANELEEKITQANVSSKGTEYSKEDYPADLVDFKEDGDDGSEDNHDADHHYDDCKDSKFDSEGSQVRDAPEQVACSGKQDNDCNIVEQAQLTLECEQSGKISLRIVFDIKVFQKLKMEMSQLPPEKASLTYVITVEKGSMKVFEQNLDRTLEHSNSFPLEYQLQLGSEYKIKAMIQKCSSLDSNFTTFMTLEACHRKVLQKWQLEKLMNKAEHFEVQEANGEKLEVKYAYRNKPPHYFDNIKNNRSNIMEVYIKDNNGDPGCPINGQIKGLFFAVRPEPSTMEVPNVSPFGERRITIPIDQLVESNTRLYFADFWCHYKRHWVTLVVTKPDTNTDTFCKEHLLELSLERNPFFFCKTSSIDGHESTQKPKFYCCEEPTVELFYTENIDLNEHSITWATVETLGKRGSSTPGGIPKRQQCSTCNL